MTDSTDVVEYSVTYQDKELNRFGTIWDVSPQLDPDTAAKHVLDLSIRQAEEEDLEVLAMARANKTITKIGPWFDTKYTSQFEAIDIYAPLFGGIKKPS